MTTHNGQWIKGQSGNPGGRPRLPADVRELARRHTLDAVRTLGELMRSELAPPGVRVRAAEALLDRAWGRPTQATIAVPPRSVRDMTDEELLAIIQGHSTVELLPVDDVVDCAVNGGSHVLALGPGNTRS